MIRKGTITRKKDCLLRIGARRPVEGWYATIVLGMTFNETRDIRVNSWNTILLRGVVEKVERHTNTLAKFKRSVVQSSVLN
jgi:hypothetical protein